MLYREGIGCIACKLFDALFEVCQRTESGFVIRRYGGERFSQLTCGDHVDEQAVVQPACVHQLYPGGSQRPDGFFGNQRDLQRAGEIIHRAERNNPQLRLMCLAGEAVDRFMKRAVSADGHDHVSPRLACSDAVTGGIAFLLRFLDRNLIALTLQQLFHTPEIVQRFLLAGRGVNNDRGLRHIQFPPCLQMCCTYHYPKGSC
ncbi:hypothetical protein D3C73_506990 [compost metagenome]